MVWLIRKLVVASFLLVACSLVLPTLHGAFYVFGSDDTLSKVTEASDAMQQASRATLEAEKAEADVSTLVTRLNEADQLLTNADLAFRAGNYSNALQLAEQCTGLANNIATEAVSLKLTAEANHQQKLILTVAVSSVGLSLLFTLSLVGWRFLKNRRARQLLKMKPEVEKDG